MAKAIYFDPKKFVASVISDMKLGEESAPTILELGKGIEALLGDRILATVVRGMDDREFSLFNNILDSHPELSEVDALIVMAPNIQGLKEKLEATINSLHSQLVYDAENIEINLSPQTV